MSVCVVVFKEKAKQHLLFINKHLILSRYRNLVPHTSSQRRSTSICFAILTNARLSEKLFPVVSVELPYFARLNLLARHTCQSYSYSIRVGSRSIVRLYTADRAKHVLSYPSIEFVLRQYVASAE
jgi:hypothetical protein